MIALLGALLGFAAPFLPELFKWLNHKQEYAHELRLMELRLEMGAQEHLWRMEEVSARADIEEAREIHKPTPSFGIQLLDAAQNWGFGRVILTPAFFLFVLIDALNAIVRPGITLAMFGLYAAYKYARLHMLQSVSDKSFTWQEGVMRLWDENDLAVLLMVLAYWFGQRSAKWAFGRVRA